jgi:hypothetical protein
MTFSSSLPVVGRRLIGRKFWGNLGFLPVFGMVDFCFLPGLWKMRQPKTMIKYMYQVDQRSSWKVPEVFIWNASIPQAFLNFKECINFFRSYDLIF